jgi:hypothetical protein
VPGSPTPLGAWVEQHQGVLFWGAAVLVLLLTVAGC